MFWKSGFIKIMQNRPFMLVNLFGRHKTLDIHYKNFFYESCFCLQNLSSLYYSLNCENICERLKKKEIKTICTNKRNIKSRLVNNKEKTNVEDKSGIYKIFCNECPAFYIGQTGRKIKTRVDEHKRSILYNACIKTGFSEHCINSNHFIDFEKTKCLHAGNKGKRV
ncbi:hypothetical protein WA026_013175 [Henosepilachna vigintioctopunctata]|uniref:GIY-YIG domain-containing protein n=1 Tax=Henosepilachna vigintioctopunctata TaxID=420089 RepID=A0AAW1ULB4_9CUCU